MGTAALQVVVVGKSHMIPRLRIVNFAAFGAVAMLALFCLGLTASAEEDASKKEVERADPVSPDTKPAKSSDAVAPEKTQNQPEAKSKEDEKEDAAPKAKEIGEAPKGETETKGTEGEGEGKGKGKVAGEPLPESRANYSADKYKSLGERFFKFPVTGSLWSRYRFRTGTEDKDQDFSQNLSMDIGDKARQMATGHLNARWSQDLDGRNIGLDADEYTQIIDTFGSSTEFRLYSAHVDFHKIPSIDLLRVGRQFTYDTPEILQFDGLRLDTQPFLGKHALKFSFYGGLPVHEFEASSQGDTLVGGAVEGKPFRSVRLRFDYTRIDDEVRRDRHQTPLVYGDRKLSSNFLSWSYWQRWRDPFIRLHSRFTMLDGKPREGTVRFLYNNIKEQLYVSARYNGWFKEQQRLVSELDTFFDTLQGFEPHHKGTLVVTKGWGDHFSTEVGAAFRRLAGGGNEARFNREFDRFHATFEARDLPIKNLTSSVSGYLYHGHSSAPDTREAAADITYKWDKMNRTSVGTGYALFKFDVFTGEERDEVRTYYLKHRFRPRKWAILDLDYEYEVSRGGEWHSARLTFRFNF